MLLILDSWWLFSLKICVSDDSVIEVSHVLTSACDRIKIEVFCVLAVNQADITIFISCLELSIKLLISPGDPGLGIVAIVLTTNTPSFKIILFHVISRLLERKSYKVIFKELLVVFVHQTNTFAVNWSKLYNILSFEEELLFVVRFKSSCRIRSHETDLHANPVSSNGSFIDSCRSQKAFNRRLNFSFSLLAFKCVACHFRFIDKPSLHYKLKLRSVNCDWGCNRGQTWAELVDYVILDNNNLSEKVSESIKLNLVGNFIFITFIKCGDSTS